MSRLLDPKKEGETDFPFQYTPSVKTDVKTTIERARERQKEEAAQRLKNVIQRRFAK